jgi:hypothetical protein
MAELQRCYSCRWCFNLTDDADGISEGVGECRRYAPQPKATSVDLDFTSWPKVFSEDGCGDWTTRFIDT